MITKKFHILLLVILLIVSAFVEIDNSGFHIPEGWPKPVYDFKSNPYTREKIELGRSLFYDPLLSVNNSTSCASCHSPYNAFAHTDHQLSHGIYDSIGTRNAPALMNLAWQNRFMWDGSISDLNIQAMTPLSHPSEMGETIENVIFKLNQKKYYRTLCYHAFGDSTINKERFLKSLAQFELSLVSAESKYDSVMRHQSVFTEQELNGYTLFKTNCSACHKEPLFTDYSFKNNGLPADQRLHDPGKMKLTGLSGDSLLFKVPTLRNIEYSFPYMHDGRFSRLSEVLKHYTSGIADHHAVSPELRKPLNLSSAEKVDLIAFLLTLSDRKFVFNPEHQFPKNLLGAQ